MHTTTPPPPPPAPGEAGKKQGDGFLASVTKHWLPFFTAILVLATAALGLYTKQIADERDEAQAGSSELEADKAALELEIEALEQQKAALEADLEEAQATPVTTLRDGTTATTLDPTPEILRQTGGTPVTIGFGHGIDLDTDADNWGIDDGGTDIYSDGGPSISGSQFSLVGAPPTPVSCAASTLPITHITAAQTVVGQQFCVHTDEGRWAYVRIAAIDPEARTIAFDVTVWKLPSDP
jgi:hypothetical protein